MKAWLREDITAELKAANAAWAANRMAVMHERVAAVGRRGAAALAELEGKRGALSSALDVQDCAIVGGRIAPIETIDLTN